jgi:hypothetical protein
VRLAPTLHARRGLWSAGFMRVLKIDEFTENDQRLFTQPLTLARLGRYLIDMHRVRGARAAAVLLSCLFPFFTRPSLCGAPELVLHTHTHTHAPSLPSRKRKRSGWAHVPSPWLFRP